MLNEEYDLLLKRQISKKDKTFSFETTCLDKIRNKIYFKADYLEVTLSAAARLGFSQR